jgi:hypothetical protein
VAGDSVNVAGQIIEHCTGALNSVFTVDDPVLLPYGFRQVNLFELALNWLCFSAKSSLSGEKWGKLGLFCIKKLICRTFSTDVECIKLIFSIRRRVFSKKSKFLKELTFTGVFKHRYG